MTPWLLSPAPVQHVQICKAVPHLKKFVRVVCVFSACTSWLRASEGRIPAVSPSARPGLSNLLLQALLHHDPMARIFHWALKLLADAFPEDVVAVFPLAQVVLQVVTATRELLQWTSPASWTDNLVMGCCNQLTRFSLPNFGSFVQSL